jgi:iron(III) transport system substrate-binding protein
MKNPKLTWLAVAAVAALTLTACAGGADPAPSGTPGGAPSEDAVELLGGAEAAAEMDELYQAALDSGKTSVTIYGPGETDKEKMYELFSERFPGISVTGVYILGPDYAAKIEAEFASGQHVADIVQAGDTAIASNIKAGYFEPFRPVTAQDVDPEAYADPAGTVWAASASTFGFLYNTNLIDEGDAPAGWDDLLDPSLAGAMTSDDVTRNGAGFGTLSHLLWDGRFDTAWLDSLAAQDITFQSSSPVAGSAVATGQFAVQPFYPMAFYLRDKAKNAPVEFVFPTEGGVHLSPHYLGVINGAPNPDAAKLLMAWLFSPEGQEAAAEVGYYPLVPGQSGPEGLPPVEELDLLKPFNLDDVGGVMAGNLDIVKEAFAG